MMGQLPHGRRKLLGLGHTHYPGQNDGPLGGGNSSRSMREGGTVGGSEGVGCWAPAQTGPMGDESDVFPPRRPMATGGRGVSGTVGTLGSSKNSPPKKITPARKKKHNIVGQKNGPTSD